MNINEIKKELQKGKKVFSVFEKADEAITVLVGLEQNKKDFEGLISKLKKEVKKLEDRVEHEKVLAGEVQDLAEKRLADATAQARETLKSAKDKAADLLTNAYDESKKSEVLNKELQTKTTKLSAEISKKEQTLSEINAKIAKAKSSIQSIGD